MPVLLKCNNCGKEYLVPPSHKNISRYCSVVCRDRGSFSIERRKKMSVQRKNDWLRRKREGYQMSENHKSKIKNALGKYYEKHIHHSKGKQISEKHYQRLLEGYKKFYEKNGSPTKGKKYPMSEEVKRKISLAKIGKPLSPEHIEKLKLGLLNRNYKHSDEIKSKIKLLAITRWQNPKFIEKQIIMRRNPMWKKKISDALKKIFQNPQNHPNWLGGKSFEPYGIKFNKNLREQIRQRDQHRCQECFRHQNELRTKTNKPYKLAIHHIDFNKQNNSPFNLISLCRPCHMQTNFSRENWTKHFQERLSQL